MKRAFGALIIFGLLGLGLTAGKIAGAETAESPNFQATDLQFDSLSPEQGCSDQYCAEAQLGRGLNAPGGVNSLSYPALKDDQPQLDISIVHGSTNIGKLSVDRPATKTIDIKVRNHLTGGYLLYIVGEPPKIGDHTLEALAKPTNSQPGVEQFGINLVANQKPAVGQTMKSQALAKNSKQQAAISDDYSEANKFKFSSGDVIAKSSLDSGQDSYVVSMIVNVSSATPPGKYDGGLAILAVPGF